MEQSGGSEKRRATQQPSLPGQGLSDSSIDNKRIDVKSFLLLNNEQQNSGAAGGVSMK
jgi:hypothetical protein